MPPIDDGEELWIRVRAVTENGLKHPLKCATPEVALVDFTLTTTGNERVCLQCSVDSFDPATEDVFLNITADERRSGQKMWVDPCFDGIVFFNAVSRIKVRLFNWKQFGPMTREVLEREDIRLCKLECQFCMRIADRYEPVSLSSFTTLIEDGRVHLMDRLPDIIIALQWMEISSSIHPKSNRNNYASEVAKKSPFHWVSNVAKEVRPVVTLTFKFRWNFLAQDSTFHAMDLNWPIVVSPWRGRICWSRRSLEQKKMISTWSLQDLNTRKLTQNREQLGYSMDISLMWSTVRLTWTAAPDCVFF